jgi:ABC-type branched-subunit amino acid transport system permease subunit
MNWPLIISNSLYTAIGVQAVGFILAAIGINMHFGYTGLLNFGQAAFAAVGAYAIAVPVRTYGWSIWAAIFVVFLAATVLALVLGVPTLRLRADYLAIVTIAAAEILRLVVNSVRYTKTLGGADGLQGFTRELERINPLPSRDFFFWKQPIQGYVLFIIIVGWILVVVCSLVTYLLMRSPWGRVLKSIREDEDAARSLGKNIFAYKMQSLIIGGIFGALGGVILACGGRAAAPGDYSTAFTFFAWTLLILGGLGRVIGPIIGGIIYWFVIGFSEVFLSEATANDILPKWLVTENNFGLFRFMLSGLGLALLVIFRPQGVFGDRREQAFDVR